MKIANALIADSLMWEIYSTIKFRGHVIRQLQNDGPTKRDVSYVVNASSAMDKTSEGCCKEILRSYMSRHYCGDLDGAYEVIEKNCAGSMSVKVAKSALRNMLPFPLYKKIHCSYIEA
ncbi:uncharacterized protein LOC131302007 [Rhododendron vialii]|uniref:uncharacterized protein LOC131302007 n=1 Tax=Rhododendron vialii TaxID=182163 RepID=UPI00265D8313|nr:uncharacterized protein LOC131302007 [Rhododendron vialii]XP_058184537.1 uncharacterized protein LOC131302007 [Rhododendron vialii]XP_058184538.1 uncharacterized protein LOC131302007 [Rhododendron vialii]